MAEIPTIPSLEALQISTVNVGSTETVPPHLTSAPVPSDAAAMRADSESTDPIAGIGAEGEIDVWEARYSSRNFIGRFALRIIISIAWIVGAVYTWGYNHDGFAIPMVVAGIVVLILWLVLLGRVIQARFGHHYRLTTRRLFVSKGVFRHERDQMELLRVQDVLTRQQSLMERILGLGTVIVVPSDKRLPTLHVLGVDDPKGIMDLIWHHARAEQDQRNVRVESL